MWNESIDEKEITLDKSGGKKRTAQIDRINCITPLNKTRPTKMSIKTKTLTCRISITFFSLEEGKALKVQLWLRQHCTLVHQKND